MNDHYVVDNAAMFDVRMAIGKNSTVMPDRVAFIHRHRHGESCNERCERVPSLNERLAAEAAALAGETS